MVGLFMKALAAVVPIVLIKLISKWRYQRLVRFKGWPQLKGSFIWGHMVALNDAMKANPPGLQLDTLAEGMLESMGRPPLFVLDVWPINYPVVIVANHDIAEQITKSSKLLPYSAPKSVTISYIDPLIGEHSMVTRNGEEWKALRRRFNPGFSPQHLIRLVPMIVDKLPAFLAHLDRVASTGEVAELAQYTTDLTFDIIGTATMDTDFNAQAPRSERSELINIYGDLIDSFQRFEDTPIAPRFFHPFNMLRQKRLARRLDPLMKAIVREKHAELRKKGAGTMRSVLSLSLQDVEELTPEILQSSVDQLKTFLFAGHDTTSILAQWAFYELERSPRAAAALCAELDALFGADPDPEVVMRALKSEKGEDIIRGMTYTTAFIKEVLRAHPPAGSARMTKPGTGFFVTDSKGKEYCLDGTIIYVCPEPIQRDPKVFGDTRDDFLPERWLDEGAEVAGGVKIDEAVLGQARRAPAGAWRPFERGPRNCIGQELALLEAKVILACVARRYDFVKVGLGALKRDEEGRAVSNGRGQYETDTELYNTRHITAKPVDNMKARVRIKAGAKPVL